MKKFLLLALLIGLPSPLFAGSSTDGYKKMDSCNNPSNDYKTILAKKEGSSSKKWGTYKCAVGFNCWTNSQGAWITKGVSYDEAYESYEDRGC